MTSRDVLTVTEAAVRHYDEAGEYWTYAGKAYPYDPTQPGARDRHVGRVERAPWWMIAALIAVAVVGALLSESAMQGLLAAAMIAGVFGLFFGLFWITGSFGGFPDRDGTPLT